MGASIRTWSHGSALLAAAIRMSNRLAESAWFSYATILMLQLHAAWGVWNAPMLGFGDTSGYFVEAASLVESGTFGNLANSRLSGAVMSPLYIAYYALVFALTRDPYTATWLHRLILALVASTAALALFRQLLPAGVAWILAAWWCLLPIIFNTKYEVHLFGALPVLVAGAIAAAYDSPRGRGAALAILIGGGVVVRNELMFSALVFAFGCTLLEYSRRRPSQKPTDYLLAYALPLTAATGVVMLLNTRVPDDLDLESAMDHRHRVNMSQVYAFGYQQRHPEWQKSPWTEFGDLLTETFGTPRPSIGEMVRINPSAMLEHFAWNLRLTPYGLQLLLFSEISGELNPDYPPPTMNSRRALVLSILLAGLWAVGGYHLLRTWRARWIDQLRPKIGGWMLLLAAASTAPLIILVQRPRPSYLFGLAALLMAITGLCIFTLNDLSPAGLRPRLRGALAMWPLAAIALVAGAPQLMEAMPAVRTPLFPQVERLWPHREALSGDGRKLYSAAWTPVLHKYVCRHASCANRGVPPLERSDKEIESYLESNGYSDLYLEERLHGWIRSHGVSERPFLDFTPDGWTLVDSGPTKRGQWMLYSRLPQD